MKTLKNFKTIKNFSVITESLFIAILILFTVLTLCQNVLAQPAIPSVPNLYDDYGISTADDITYDSTPRFTGTSDANVIIILESDIDGSFASGVANSSGSWTSYSYGTPLSEGTHSVRAMAFEPGSGLASAWSAGLTVTIDTTIPPTIPSTPDMDAASDNGNSSTDNITNDSTPTFNGSGADPNLPVYLYVSGYSGNKGTTTADASGNWTITSSAISEGTYTVTVRVMDTAGNIGNASAALTITIDYTTPSASSAPDMAASSDTGTSSTDNLTNDTTPTFTGTAEANASIILYSGATQIGTDTATGGIWTITASTLSSGIHNITANATDVAGNPASASSALTIEVDTTPPATPSAPDMSAASDTGSLSTDNITSNTTPVFSGTAATNTSITLNSSLSGSVGTANADGSGNWSITSGTLSQGNHNITITATDTAGNTSAASPALAVTIDTTAPAAPSAPDMTDASDTGPSNTDNITANTTPVFTGTAEAGASVSLYSGATLIGSGTAAAGNWSITASTLSSGTQSITAKATDAAGNVSVASAALSVTIDTSAPGAPWSLDMTDASDTGSSITDNLTNDTTPVITGMSEPNITINLFSNVAGNIGTGTSDGSGTWSITSAALTPVAHQITAQGTDNVGNISPVSSALTITIDTTAPAAPSVPDMLAVSDSGTSNTDNITNNTTPFFSGTAAIGTTITLVSSVSGTVGTGTADGSGNWNITAIALSQNTHNITATATDTAGNVSGASGALSVTVDTTAPLAPSVPDMTTATDSGSSSTDNITNNAMPVFTGTGEANATITLSSSINGTLSTTSADGSGNWTFTTVSNLSSGIHSITAKATDAAGNISSASTALSVTIDTTVPGAPSPPDMTAATDTGTSTTDNLTSNSAPVFTGTAEPGTLVTLNSNVDGVKGTATADGSGNWSITASPALSENSHSMTATATDTAGNISTASTALNIIIDITAPAAPSTPDMTPATDLGSSNTDNLTGDNTPDFIGTAEANSTVTLISSVDGTIGTATANGTGNWSLTANTLNEGSHNITATATDAAGNISAASAALPITIDTNPPAVPSTPDMTSATDTGNSNTDNITANNMPVFIGTSDANIPITLNSNVDGVIGTTTADASGNWSITASAMSDGTHSITATATNTASGSSSISTALSGVVIDTGIPTIVSVTSATPDGSYKTGNVINVAVNFSEPVILAGGNLTINLNTGAGITILPFTLSSNASGSYTVAAGHNTTDLNTNSPLILAGGASLRDLAGNNVILTIPAGQFLADSRAIIIDTTAPAVTLSSAAPQPTNTSPIPIAITFTENITGFDISDLLIIGGTAANFTNTVLNQVWTADIIPNGAGNVTVNIAAGAAQDNAGNTSTAATQLLRTFGGVLWVINEIHAAPDIAGGDANGDGIVNVSDDEFVEIINNTGVDANISGWRLSDSTSVRHVFPAGTWVAAGCGILVFGGGTPAGTFGYMTVQTASTGTLNLNDTGDTITLNNGVSNQAVYPYGTEGGDNQSLTRSPDITGTPMTKHTLVSGTRFSPGTKTNGTGFTCNTAPTTTGISNVTVNEDAADTSIDLWLSFNDAETADHELTYTVENNTNPALFNSAGINTNHYLVLDYADNINGTADITLRATDNGGMFTQYIETTFTVTVNQVNDPPSFTAYNPSASNEDAGTQTVMNWITGINLGPANESAQTALVYSVSNISNPGLFSALPAVSPAGTLTYTAAPNKNGTSAFTVTLRDNGGTVNGGADTSASQTFTITVNAVNDAPIANNETYTATEDIPLTVFAPSGVLINDTDIEGNALTAVNVSNPANGSITLNTDGSFVYTPKKDFFGTDSFSYKAYDTNYSNTATVTITVNGTNDPPVANNESYTVTEDTPLVIPAAGVLTNDTDIDGNPLNAVKASDPFNGTLTLGADGAFTYVPKTNYTGADGFTYKAFDGIAYSNAATVTLNVGKFNDTPVANSDGVYTASEDTPLIIPAPGVLSNDTDTEGDALIAVKVSDPAHGTVTLNANGAFTYTAVPYYYGSDSFLYKVSDGSSESAAATVSIMVNPVQNTPVAVDDNYSAMENKPLIIPADAGLLINDTDFDNDPLTAVKVNNPFHGTVTLNSDGSFTYTPEPKYTGTDSFLYLANDGVFNSNIATVTIVVGEANEMISGHVMYFSASRPIPDAMLGLEGENETYTAPTGSDGYYEIIAVPSNQNYVLTLTRPETPDTYYISATDISRTARNAAKLIELTEYEQLAADVTLNGRVSGLDASRMAQFSVGLISAMNTENITWTFLPASMAYMPLSSDMENQDFIGVRLGDVTGKYIPAPVPLTLRSQMSDTGEDLRGQILLNWQNPAGLASIQIDPDSMFSIPIVIEQNMGIEGIDIAVEFDENVLDALSVTLSGGILDGGNYDMAINTNIDGRMVIKIFAVSDLSTGSGTVATLNFNVSGKENDSTVLALTEFACNTVSVSDSNPEPGIEKDINISGGFYVNNTISHAVSIVIQKNQENLMTYDFNGNGRVDLPDAVYALRTGDVKAAVRVLQVLAIGH